MQDTVTENNYIHKSILNSCNVTCPVWNGQDSAGRFVCEDSFYTKSPGCNCERETLRPYLNCARDECGIENGQKIKISY